MTANEAMPDTVILTDLCSSCHFETPKYRCPGCGSRTCSLRCSKLHKDRAQCSGLRDPTAYLKKSQLATPAAFDHDFNFISKLERNLKAERQGLVSATRTIRASVRSKDKRSELYRRRMNDMGVTVIQAPKGMQRERENQSRIGKKSHDVIWTIEWLYGKQRCLTTSLSETRVGSAFTTAAKVLGISHPQLPIYKRKREESKEAIRHYHFNNGSHTKSSNSSALEPQTVLKLESDAAKQINDKTVKQSLHDSQIQSESHHDRDWRHLAGTAYDRASDGPELATKTTKVVTESPDDDSDVTEQHNLAARDQRDPSGDNWSSIAMHGLFLVKASGGNDHALIAIKADHTITQILRGQAVIEFPTIRIVLDPDPATQEDG